MPLNLKTEFQTPLSLLAHFTKYAIKHVTKPPETHPKFELQALAKAASYF